LELAFTQPASEFTLERNEQKKSFTLVCTVHPVRARRTKGAAAAAGSFLLFFPDVELTHSVSRQQRQRHMAFDSSRLFPDVLVAHMIFSLYTHSDSLPRA
jgi:hypothetical protein